MVDGHKINTCPECAGLWIPGKLINQLVGPGKRKILAGLCKEHLASLACPHDGWGLGEATIRGVTVDFCPNCHGLWLDSGELKALQKGVKLKKKRRRGKSEIEGAETLLEVGGVAVDGLFTLLTGLLSI